mmetsp:Transcript_27262/g.55676  ORF Transcript_27262/g.55676 Transcript_27262/m.55676 type:complete len:220 (+) Transcript_27262:272-931(+)|eukprot:CAMPEP_0181301826 /NCGR_PEP_ID=MMETSP1101-20121128/7638_1 /TAXON_ID=46948 /ORGANISM="Rhodomonas abbreviata, Strain Caron Lab Isolate" /LENGTH=219 /DNA_ID=CAMNT_0023407171 /DNA_START=249 /DNA_END=908 /DNA_ORIENTATION=-
MSGEYLARLRHSKHDGANGGRPKKLLSHILKIVSLLDTGSSEEVDAAYRSFAKEVELFKFSMGKIQIIGDTSLREVEAYLELQEELKKEMLRTEEDIVKLKERVAHERVVRKNKEEYAALAKQVETLAPRKQTEKDRTVLVEQTSLLEEQTAKQTGTMELRKKQFQLLLHVVEELKKNCNQDEEPESAAPTLDSVTITSGAATVSPAVNPDVEMGEADP